MKTNGTTGQRLLGGLALTLTLLLGACGTTTTTDDTDDGTSTGGDPISTGTTSEVVTAANAFLATLSTSQQSSVVLTRTESNSTTWSNLPVNSVARNGIALSSLTETQRAAALSTLR